MAKLVAGNRLTLLRNGAEYFPALEAAIEAACNEVHLQSYIFADDVTGRQIAGALAGAVGRGVRVWVVVDGVGTRKYLGAMLEEMRAVGIQVINFRPELAPIDIERQRLRRMHRKVVAVDRRVAFVGGINVIDDMNTPNHTPPRIDFAVQIEGPLVADIAESARQLWNVLAWRSVLEGSHAPVRSAALSPGSSSSSRSSSPSSPSSSSRSSRSSRSSTDAASLPPTSGAQRAALVVRDNFRHRSDIEDEYLAAIEGAREEVIIANAYFFPGRRFRRALTQAAARGVRVSLLLQGRVEYVLLHYATRALYGSLLEAGVEIHEYHKSFLHAKAAVIDSRWATVGSSNIDPFSLLLAREANLVVEDRRFALDLRSGLLDHMQEGATAVAKLSWRRLPIRERVRIWIGYGVARFLIGMYGYGGRH